MVFLWFSYGYTTIIPVFEYCEQNQNGDLIAVVSMPKCCASDIYVALKRDETCVSSKHGYHIVIYYSNLFSLLPELPQLIKIRVDCHFRICLVAHNLRS